MASVHFPAAADLIADTHGVAGRGNVSTKSGDNRAAFFGNDMLYFLVHCFSFRGIKLSSGSDNELVNPGVLDDRVIPRR